MALAKIESPGIDGGMNLAVSPTLIGHNQAEYAIDCLFDEPGVVKRRGAFTQADQICIPTGGYQVFKSFTTQRTDGTIFVGMVCILGSTNLLYFISADQNFSNQKIEPITVSTGVSQPLITVKPALGGGVWVGVSNQAEATATPTTSGRQFLWLWKGGSFVSAGYVMSATPVAIGDTTVTLNAAPSPNLIGGFVYNNAGHYIGCIKSVTGAVATLERPASDTAGAGSTVGIRPVRAFIPHYSKGLITCSTGSTFVAGSGVDFSRMNTTWRFFRSSDNAYIGTVSTVTNGTSITLAANALQNMANEAYWAIAANQNCSTVTPTTIDPRIEPNSVAGWDAPGWINVVHQGRQWFFNRNKLPDAAGDYVSRAWFSDPQQQEAIDFNLTDGDFFQVGSGPDATGPILEAVSIQNQLLVFREAEVWAIVGDSPTNYTTKKLFSDGLVCTTAWAPWNDGLVWIGRRGVYYYDGVSSPVNLVKDTMGKKWVDYLKAFSQANGDRAWVACLRDHAMLSISNPVNILNMKTTSQSNFLSSNVTAFFMPVIYIPTQALSFWTNMCHQGGFQMSGVLNSRNVLTMNLDPLTSYTQVSGILDTANVFNGGTAQDKFPMNRGGITQSNANQSLPTGTIQTVGMPTNFQFPAGTVYIDGDPNNPVSYTGISGNNLTGCTGGTGSTVSGVTLITNAPLGPWFYLASRREDAGDPMLLKGWRQFTLQYLANANVSLFTSTGIADTGKVPRINPTITASAGLWAKERHRFAHTGTYLQWRLMQTDLLNSLDFRVQATDLFFKPQRARRVKAVGSGS